jgi:gamma-D-glutamyl-L-lysine dipeptidyl-peptidase
MATEQSSLPAGSAILVGREAVVRTPVAPMHAEPRIASQMVSQQVAGHCVDVLDIEGEWACTRGSDGYEAWMHHGFLEQPSGDVPAKGSARRVSLGCVVRSAAGRRSLPLRALVAPDETIQSGGAVDAAEIVSRFPLDPVAIARTAEDFFQGTSYVWGGVTPWGADCSGLVQSVFSLHGLQLPRDAWQQAEVGSEIGRDLDRMRAGDLLFFSDRPDQRVTHVGISLGKRRMVHLALGRGGFAIEHFNAGDAYLSRLMERFLFAKRVF